MNISPTDPMIHLHKLANEIGERPAGSVGHQNAANYVKNIFQKTGLTIKEQIIDFPSWSSTDCKLILGTELIEIDANPFSSSCDIFASIVAIGTIAELETAQLTGKIALLYGEISSAPLFPMGFTIYNPDRDKRINQFLVDKQPRAILAINPLPFRYQHIIEDPDMPIPSATISAEVGLKLMKNLDKQVKLQILTKQKRGTVTTFIARQPRLNQNKLVLCAHYDTKFGTPGAYDNGSGLAALLCLAEGLAEHKFAVDLEFIAWADEEYGGNSDQAYAEKANFDEMLGIINLDGVAQYTGTNTVTMLAQSDMLQERVKKIIQDYPKIAWVDPWFASNHYTFYAHNVPCIVFGAIGTNTVHQANDTTTWIDPSKLKEIIAIVDEIVEHIQHVSVDQARVHTSG